VICAGFGINGMGVAGLLILLGRRRFAVLYTIDIDPFSRFLARFVKLGASVNRYQIPMSCTRTQNGVRKSGRV
jgi:hypothetical protein